jgi:DNA (cytosine-5)-methyltransferase 1
VTKAAQLGFEAPLADATSKWASDWLDFLRGGRAVVANPVSRVRVLDLFSGVGGLAIGFAKAAAERGVVTESVGAVDLDESALSVYAANFGTTLPRAASVTSLVDFQVRGEGASARFLYEPEMIGQGEGFAGQVDVVLAGPPCQGHSSLNNRTRCDDPRNRLYLTVPAVAVAAGATTVIVENVPGVMRSKGNVVDTATTLLQDAGYSITTAKLAADRLGWPQTRERFFLVGTRERHPISLVEIAANMRREPLPISWAIADLLDVDSSESDLMNSTAELSPENAERMAWLFANDEHDMPNHLRPDCHKEGTTYGAVYGRMWWDKPAPTLTTGFLTSGRGRFIHPKRPRTLTPREAARIQGFPDWYDFSGEDGSVPSRKQLTTWIGNAVPTILGYAVGISALGDADAVSTP